MVQVKPLQLAVEIPPEAVSEPGGRANDKINILLVDDQPNNLFALETLLGGNGYTLVRAASGAEALRCVLEREFALILLDVLMPGMDGFETAQLIRQRRRSTHTPIIFLTATSTNETHVGQGYFLGAVDYIYKPIVAEVLKAKVHVFAELYRKTQSLARSEAALRSELEARRESEEKYRKLFTRASDAIVVFDADSDTVIDVNKAALELYGYSETAFLKLTSKALEAKADEGGGSRADQCRNQTFMRFHKKADGALFPAEITCAAVTLKGKKLIMVLTRDISERQKAAEAELLREREAMQRQLVATVSHELRTPIAAIKASAETLSLGEMENVRTRTRFLKIIENQANRLGGLVEDLLLVAELESGKCKPVTSSIPLAVFLKEMLPSIGVLARKKTVSISAKIDPKLTVLADRSHLTGIFQNLLDNAIKYNKKNGRIAISAIRNHAGEAEVSVRDTGIGIPAADFPLIFQQFHRAPSVRELCIKGTGLGLYIIKTMVDSNEGRIWAENAPDEGTIFSFTLPLDQA